MNPRVARAVGMLCVGLVAVGFASCGRESGGDGGGAAAGAGGEWASHGAGESSEAGNGSDAGAVSGGRAMVPASAGGGSGAGQGGRGGTPDDMSCAAGAPNWWSNETNSCHDCPAMATVECDEIVAGARYDMESSTLTLELPPGRLEVVTASLGVTFNYVNSDPEQYEDVKAAIEGDTLTFDFSAYRGSGISSLSGEPLVEDSCGDYLNVHAPGVGFGPAIMVQLEPPQGEGGAANYPDIVCGKTN